MEQHIMPPWTLLCACAKANIPCAAILTFAADGDNIPEANAVAGAAAKAIPAISATDIVENGWIQPPSWKYAFSTARPNPALL